jgi:hypothetical protein
VNVSSSLADLCRIATNYLKLPIKIAYLKTRSRYIWYNVDVTPTIMTIWVGDAKQLQCGGLSGAGTSGVFRINAFMDNGSQETITITSSGAVIISNGNSTDRYGSQPTPIVPELNGTGDHAILITSPKYGYLSCENVGLEQSEQLTTYADSFADQSRWCRLNRAASLLKSWGGDVRTPSGFMEQIYVSRAGDAKACRLSVADAMRHRVYGDLTHFAKSNEWASIDELFNECNHIAN